MEWRKWLGAVVLVGVMALPALSSLEEARVLRSQGENAAAFDKYLEAVFNDPLHADANFELGMVAMSIGRYETAADAFERILMANPNLPRVRLELGRAYMMLENYTLARLEFERVLEQRPPDTVKRNVETLIAQMEQADKRYALRGRLSVGGMYDTNANVATYNSELRLAGGLELQNTGMPPQRKWADVQALDATLQHDFGQRGGAAMEYSAGVTRVGYHSNASEYNAEIYSFGITPLYASGGKLFRFGFLLDEIRIGHDHYARYYGFAPSLLTPLNDRLALSASVLFQKRDVTDNDLMDSTYTALEVAPRYTLLDGKLMLQMRGRLGNNHAEAAENSYRMRQIGFGGFAALPWQLTGSAFTSYTWNRYKDKMAVAATGAPLFDEARRDEEWRYNLGLTRRFDYGMSASFTYTWVDNRSNLDIYDYDREQFMFMLSKEF
ncbi:surface lipoprotein assembly modifier [Chrysiogenes arsenatis]|uniref:surface lipoprotein assembly modifier n=1 Tax=Chrysiogenes arsenatis TaxID=309797 RepID=UPI0003FE430E|nr:tetratricopeptide repeat protein [Chrysiogenes arsenatis]